MKNLIAKIKSSIYDPQYYRELRERTLGYSFKYYFSFILVFAIVLTAIISVRVVPPFIDGVKMIRTEVLDKYPAELEVRIKEGIVSTNVTEPYFIKVPAKDRAENEKANIIVIDSSASFSQAKYDEYDTLVLLTKDSLAYESDSGETTNQTLEGVKDWTVNKTIVAAFIVKIEPYLKAFGAILPLLIFFGILVAGVWRLVYLLFAALVIWVVLNAKNIEGGYPRAYQAVLHLVTLPIIVFALVGQITSFYAPLLFTISIIVMAVLNLKQPDITEVPEIASATPPMPPANDEK